MVSPFRVNGTSLCLGWCVFLSTSTCISSPMIPVRKRHHPGINNLAFCEKQVYSFNSHSGRAGNSRDPPYAIGTYSEAHYTGRVDCVNQDIAHFRRFHPGRCSKEPHQKDF
jgi:hypothetical protein